MVTNPATCVFSPLNPTRPADAVGDRPGRALTRPGRFLQLQRQHIRENGKTADLKRAERAKVHVAAEFSSRPCRMLEADAPARTPCEPRRLERVIFEHLNGKVDAACRSMKRRSERRLQREDTKTDCEQT